MALILDFGQNAFIFFYNSSNISLIVDTPKASNKIKMSRSPLFMYHIVDANNPLNFNIPLTGQFPSLVNQETIPYTPFVTLHAVKDKYQSPPKRPTYLCTVAMHNQKKKVNVQFPLLLHNSPPACQTSHHRFLSGYPSQKLPF